jgi:hypothetical protein
MCPGEILRDRQQVSPSKPDDAGGVLGKIL